MPPYMLVHKPSRYWTQCCFFNHASSYDCNRCRKPRYPEATGGRDRDSHHVYERRHNVDDIDDSQRRHNAGGKEEDVDEFGRSLVAKPPKKRKWPPCFETEGGAYVFDTRSGMFYESITDFFYDPKSKLYYGNMQGTYFNFNVSTKTFEEVKTEDVHDAASLNTSRTENTTGSSVSSGNQSKSVSISINLKTKELPSTTKACKKTSKSASAKEAKAKPSTEIAAVTSRKHSVDIEKWSERQAEKRLDTVPQLSGGKVPLEDKVATTAKGEPICLLCRRKFPTMEKLQCHEQVSALHKENLSKQAAKEQTSASDAKYIDRAEQRRIMHGTSDGSVNGLSNDMTEHPAPFSVDSKNRDETQVAASVLSHDSLGESSVGNQLLQKMGWKAGNAIGKQQVLNPEGGIPAPQQQPAIAGLKREWDRIEATAASKGVRPQQRSKYP
jgi:RNA-binding protein 5/10